jgi:trk system potassium uptake protein TrkH
MPRLAGALVRYPARASFVWHLGLIVMGGLLLAHPICCAPGRDPISLLEAFFTSTSAVCVTGLVVRSTGSDFSLIGQLVIQDLYANWHGPWTRRWDRFQLHSKLMLIGTVALIVAGTVAILALEWDNTLRGMSFSRALLVSFFQSVICRTAGFNSVAIGQLTNATLFIMVLLMAIGAGPCSTAGGFKVSTMMLFAVRAWTTFRGYSRMSIFRRTVPANLMARATTTVLLYTAVVVGALTALLVLEQPHEAHTRAQGIFLDSLFEVVSALSTVGLSTGITPRLSDAGQVVLMLAMFIGRLGPISVVMALSLSERPQVIEYPREEPLIG